MTATHNLKPTLSTPTQIDEAGFSEILELIASSRERGLQAANTVLIDLYWRVGEIISRKIQASEWGDSIVPQLATYIARTQPGLRGFTRPNLFRMKQFYEAYREQSIVSALLIHALRMCQYHALPTMSRYIPTMPPRSPKALATRSPKHQRLSLEKDRRPHLQLA